MVRRLNPRSFPCPYCHAVSGRPCLSLASGKRVRGNHKSRINSAGIVHTEGLIPAEKAELIWNYQQAHLSEKSERLSYRELAKQFKMSTQYAHHLYRLKDKLCPSVWEVFAANHPKASVIRLIMGVLPISDPEEQWTAWLHISGQIKHYPCSNYSPSCYVVLP